MDRIQVQSSNVVSIGYDANRRALEVEFKSGGIYNYDNVDPSAFAALMAAPSIGMHLHNHFTGIYMSGYGAAEGGATDKKNMAHPAREEKAEAIAGLIEQMISAHIARYVHMSTNDKPLQELHVKLVAALADAVR